MLPAPPPRQPLQKRPAVQGDMGVLPRHGACAHESMSPQAGIKVHPPLAILVRSNVRFRF